MMIVILSVFSKKNKAFGIIAYHGLSEWWFDVLTEEERQTIREIYKPMGDKFAIDQGRIDYSSQSSLAFLGCLAGWFTKKEYYPIGVKIIAEGEKILNSVQDVIDLHYFFAAAVKVYYPNRNEQPDALDKAIDYCKKQIAISKEAKRAFKREHPDDQLPRHPGYQQLAIIYEKQHEYGAALEICRQALKEGWNTEDCIKRIDRLEKKLAKDSG